MRPLALLLPVLLLLCSATTPATAGASPAKRPAAKLRCAKGATLQRDAARRPVACVVKTPPTEAKLLAELQRAARASLGRRARKGKGPRVSARDVESVTRRLADPAKPLPGLLTRAFFDSPGPPDRHTRDQRDGSDTATWIDEKGTETETWWRSEPPGPGEVGSHDEMRTRVRDRHAGGRSMGMVHDGRLDRCPTAAGEVGGTFGYGLTIGQATAAHGQRTWSEVTVRVESPITGHVGVGAKAETFDLDLRGSVETRGWVEHTGTSRILKHLPTRTVRIAFAAQRVPVHGDVAALARQLAAGARLRGPHGATAKTQTELDEATRLMSVTLMTFEMMQEQLVAGDGRWYEQRACATREYSASASKLRAGDTATWDVEVRAADGTPVATTAGWRVRSTCAGALTVNQPDGPRAHLVIAESGGAWSADPDRHACLAIDDVTSPAGRPPVLNHAIPADDPPGRYRFTVTVEYTMAMGDAIAGTQVHASGTVVDELDDHSTEGSGTYAGTEWDGTVTNTCGQDMQRTRGISGPVIVGAEVHDDGTAMIALTAEDRPLDFSWIVFLPVTGGTQVVEGTRPFCGEPGLAKTRAVVTVTSEALPRTP